ncbi:heterokaryon incompatibility protein-domain-containing protein [Bisporella sp. PMI_857]|nr:heterokaryon incompatibility protein-domain-containing protein [Bisporella sp. PMI_857]
MSLSNILYTSLAHDDDIRLLQLHSKEKFPSIQCSLICSNLRDKPNYEALSYMWGSQDDLKTITIDGRDCVVRKNLWEALVHLQEPTTSRILWVDALCINQNDNQERNHQVSQMGVIYRQATRVLVWLGKPDLSNVARKTGFQRLEHELAEFHAARPKRQDSALRSSMVYSQLLDVRSVCLAEYWTRLWIIQEVVLATDIKLICEWSVTITWDFLIDYLEFLTTDERGFSKWIKEQDTHPFTNEANNAKDEQASIADCYIQIRQAILGSVPARLCRERQLREERSPVFNPNTSLLSLIQTYGSAKCVDRRDKVFGLHSFAPLCCRQAVPVAYAQSAYNLCGRLLHHQMLEHGGMGDPSAVISKVQQLHHVLGGVLRPKTTSSCKPSAIPAWEVEEDPLNLEIPGMIQIAGNIRGSVTYLSPSLNSKGLENQGFSYNGRAVHRRIHRELIALNARIAAPNAPLVQCLDVVQTFLYEGVQAGPRNDAASESYIKGSWNLTQVIHTASRLVISHPSSTDCVLFVEEKAMIGLAPTNTRLGDVVCQFEDSDVVAILRPVGRNYQVVGRATPLLSSGSRQEPFERHTPPRAGYTRGTFDVQDRLVNLSVDISTLQLLARTSGYDKDFIDQVLEEPGP